MTNWYTQISIATTTTKNVPIYNVKITITPKKGDAQTIRLKRPFTEWFDAQGHFIARPFQTILASTVPAIAKADPKRVAATATPGSDFMNADAAVLDALVAAESTGVEKGAGSSGKGQGKKSNRRKA